MTFGAVAFTQVVALYIELVAEPSRAELDRIEPVACPSRVHGVVAPKALADDGRAPEFDFDGAPAGCCVVDAFLAPPLVALNFAGLPARPVVTQVDGQAHDEFRQLWMGAKGSLQRIGQVAYLSVLETADEVLRLPANFVTVRIGSVALEPLVSPWALADEPRARRRVFQGCQLTAEFFEAAVLSSSMFPNTSKVQVQRQHCLHLFFGAIRTQL